MIDHARSVERDARLECDVCIVGAGAAGITIARELSGSRHQVVLLESGLETPDEATQDLYQGQVRGAKQWALATSRLRLFGGTTNHWGGTCRPLDALDFEQRPWVEHSGWPISRASLDPYYERAHAVCELGPYDYGPATWGKLVDPGPRLAGREVVVKLAQHSPPTRFGQRYRADLAAARNLRSLLHANATELVPDASGRRVEHVDVRSLDGHRFRVAARRVVLACGGIENARLLLLSNRSSPAGLGNERDLVGRFFLDHPAALPFAVLLFMDERWRSLVGETVRRGVRVLTGLSLRDEALERERLLNHAFYMRRPMTVEELRDMRWIGIRDLLAPDDLRMIEHLEALWRGGEAASASVCWLRSEQGPNPESRVTLSERLDALGQRRVVLDWQLPEINRHTFVRAAELYARILADTGLGRLKLMPWLLSDSPDPGAWVPRVSPGWHHMGTTRMAASPGEGVVDRDCRVFGVENLYVAGASVFPTAGYINPTLTLVALALRLADHLKRAPAA